MSSLEERACTGKQKMGPVRARNLAAIKRLRGERIAPYRCPWCHCWHIGHPPSMQTVERIAEEIRTRH